MELEFVIVAPDYHGKSGGGIVLHQLCHLINDVGGTAWLVPLLESRLVSPFDRLNRLWPGVGDLYAHWRARRAPWLQRNSALKTRVFKDIPSIPSREDIVVVYPEIVAGNPLGARHVARWVLHEPGFHTGNIFFCRGEVQFAFSHRFAPVRASGIEIAPFLLDIYAVPWDLFEAAPCMSRKGTAYAVRKGKGKPIVHDLADSVLIDHLEQSEIADVFKRVERFISYDTHTMYSAFAVIAGCDSIVVPDAGVSMDEWCPDEAGRAGIAYGFDDIPRARATRDLLLSELRTQDARNLFSVQRFIDFWRQRLHGN